MPLAEMICPSTSRKRVKCEAHQCRFEFEPALMCPLVPFPMARRTDIISTGSWATISTGSCHEPVLMMLCQAVGPTNTFSTGSCHEPVVEFLIKLIFSPTSLGERQQELFISRECTYDGEAQCSPAACLASSLSEQNRLHGAVCSVVYPVPKGLMLTNEHCTFFIFNNLLIRTPDFLCYDKNCHFIF